MVYVAPMSNNLSPDLLNDIENFRVWLAAEGYGFSTQTQYVCRIRALLSRLDVRNATPTQITGALGSFAASTQLGIVAAYRRWLAYQHAAHPDSAAAWPLVQLDTSVEPPPEHVRQALVLLCGALGQRALRALVWAQVDVESLSIFSLAAGVVLRGTTLAKGRWVVEAAETVGSWTLDGAEADPWDRVVVVRGTNRAVPQRVLNQWLRAPSGADETPSSARTPASAPRFDRGPDLMASAPTMAPPPKHVEEAPQETPGAVSDPREGSDTWEAAKTRLEAVLGRSPTVPEIAASLGDE